ncbi:MAG: DUF3307 domain-containing protein [Clostridia bacterium]|nr:DUF3307 domain-containing protein [Clostridia bacterium]
MKAFTVLFLAHVLGDYYFQPEALARRKERGLGWVLLHCLIYAAAMAVSLLLLGIGHLPAAALCAGTHLVIDLVKQLILIRSAKAGVLTVKGERAAFCIDQALHLIIILAASLWSAAEFEAAVPPCLESFSRLTGIDAFRALACAALALAVMKPTNVFIRRMAITQKPDGEPDGLAPESVRMGRYIGSLERLLVCALLVLRQYGSIALVFTAKSVARFKQLDDRRFAEYYIFGTLLSVASAVGMFLLLKYFGTL